jgi:hypothetical protein
MDIQNTGLASGSFTHVGLGLALHLIPKPDAVLAGKFHLITSQSKTNTQQTANASSSQAVSLAQQLSTRTTPSGSQT